MEREDYSDDSADFIEAEIPCLCFFCDTMGANMNHLLVHMNEAHGVDFEGLVQQYDDGELTRVKLVNYLRTRGLEGVSLLDNGDWKAETYLKPVLESDPMLFLCADDDDWSDSDDDFSMPVGKQDDLSGLDKDELLALLSKERVEKNKALMKLALAEDTNRKLKEFSVNRLFENEEESDEDLSEEDSYFVVYTNYKIHYDMLSDKVRTETYRDFFMKNKDYIKDKVVMDIGCGTGILSMFAAEAGAKKVIALDRSSMISNARQMAYNNGFGDKITFIHGNAEDLEELPDGLEKVDIIVSEWMGYCLLYESMLNSVIKVRNKFLREGGSNFPDRANMTIGAMADPEYVSRKIDFWDDVYGYKMDVLKHVVTHEAQIDTVKTDSIVSNIEVFKNFDLNAVQEEDLNFKSEVDLTFTKSCTVDALFGYFDVFFETGCSNPVGFSTGPFTEITHWVNKPQVEAGETMHVDILIKEAKGKHRQLYIDLHLKIGTRYEHQQAFNIT